MSEFISDHNSNISSEKFQNIKNKYGHMSSWAIWNEWKPTEKAKSGMGDISFFDNPSTELLKTLNPNIVLVGLNISRKVDRPFGNFHPNYSTAHDYKTRFALQGTPLWGAYMTDIIKDFEEKVSGKIMSFLRNNPDFTEENIASFKQELCYIGASKPILIALGKDSYKILSKNFRDEFRIYCVTHYSAYSISKEKLREEFLAIIVDIQK